MRASLNLSIPSDFYLITKDKILKKSNVIVVNRTLTNKKDQQQNQIMKC